MSFGIAAVIACIGTVLVGIAATHPLELRPHRWLKIVVSLPIVLLIATQFYALDQIRGYFAIWGFSLLAFIWKSSGAHFGSLCFSRLVYGNWNRATGVRPDFHGAKALRRHGDVVEAIQITVQELEKDPGNYEGLILLSELEEEEGNFIGAAQALKTLLGSRKLTAEQREIAQTRAKKLEDSLLLSRLNAK